MSAPVTLLINREDFADVKSVALPRTELADGYIRVSIGPFALTANNITYLVTGDQIGYWKFFAPDSYGIDEEGYGRMPVWGYGVVTQSRCEGVDPGTRIYGFFPAASEVDLCPARLSKMGFQDGAPHRKGLHPIYNSYTVTKADPSFAGGLDDIQPILRPLFTTSFLIDDFLADKDFFGAAQVLLLSASSKTAMGTAFCLKERGGIKVAGLTSERNLEFTNSSGFYDEVASYERITALNPDLPTAIVDMAGNGAVSAKVYEHFEDKIVYNCMVGKSHWQGGAPPKIIAGAPPIMFFAPDRARLRVEEWGGGKFNEKLAARWAPFCSSAANWLTVEKQSGIDNFIAAYHQFLIGKASPSAGALFTL